MYVHETHLISIRYMSCYLFLTLCFFLAIPLSNGTNTSYEAYEACSILYSCGKIRNIGYPFWGGNRPKFCGMQDFELTCNDSDQYSTINIFQYAYIGVRVLGINTSSHTITFSQSILLERCILRDVSKIALLPTLKLDPSYMNISLSYGCTGANCNLLGNHTKSFKCTREDDSEGLAYWFDESSNTSRKMCSCNNTVDLLVDKSGLDELKSTKASLLNILQKLQIKMEYSVNFTACSKCEESGGRCGSQEEPDIFLCHCQDGPHPLDCSSSPQHISHLKGKRVLILGLGTSAASLLGVFMLVVLVTRAIKRSETSKFSLLWSCRRTTADQNVVAFLQSYGSLAQKRYTYADIKKITSSFKEKLGEGGYGSVYKGRLRNGRFVAVKKLKVLKGDGKDFINEVLSISRTNHVNVVTLLGFCFEGNKRALIFEFLPNGSLEKFIYGKTIRQPLQWETVFNIAVGIARGLDYLHRGCNTRILHFDIKPHNILLDEEFRQKISDFGLARLCPNKNSMMSVSEARGTIGYIAPEVFCRNFGGASHKSDVYSYGMMLIDLVCGRKIPTNNEVQCDNSEMYFPEWIYNRLEPMQEAAVGEIEDNDKNELERKMILVSLWCIQMHPSNRPPINRVVEMLEGPFESLPMPLKPHLSSPARPVFDASPMSTT